MRGFRLATMEDLPKLKAMYEKIIANMKQNNIEIWDEVYPCEFFQEDISCNRLYLLQEVETILAAFALCESNSGENQVRWEKEKAKALYIDRFGVNVDYLRQGIGGIMLEHALQMTRQKGADYLRLFVVDRNTPAIALYLKQGFRQADGLYEEKVEDIILREYGYEIDVHSIR